VDPVFSARSAARARVPLLGSSYATKIVLKIATAWPKA
jgi:hypothetical protein